MWEEIWKPCRSIKSRKKLWTQNENQCSLIMRTKKERRFPFFRSRHNHQWKILIITNLAYCWQNQIKFSYAEGSTVDAAY